MAAIGGLKKLGVVGFVLSLVLATSVAPLDAQAPGAALPPPDTGTDLSVSPAVVDDALGPGTTYDIKIRLTNSRDNPVTVSSAASEFTTDQAVPPELREAFNASGWINVKDPEFTLAGKEQRTVAATVAVPPDAEPGGHYATINFDSVGERTEGITSVSTRVGVIVLLTVSGDLRQSIEAAGPVEVKGVQTGTGNTPMAVTLRNNGNVHVVPRGDFVVSNVVGGDVARMPITPGVLLPGAERRYEAKWEHGLKVGLYTASIDAQVGQNLQQLDRGHSRFLLAPLVIVVPIAALVLIVGLVFGIRRLRNRAEAAHAPRHAAPESPTAEQSE